MTENYRLQYRCKLCGGVETVGDPRPWKMLDHHPFIVSEPTTSIIIAATGVIIPPILIWHECHKDESRGFKIGFGLCEFAGLLPVREKEEESCETSLS
jgi:hypothetical protein